MIKQLLNSVNAKYHDLSVSRRSIICLSLLATDKSWYFAQPPPMIVNYFIMHKLCSSSQQWHWRELYRSNKKGSSQFKLRANEIHVCFFLFYILISITMSIITTNVTSQKMEISFHDGEENKHANWVHKNLWRNV